MPSESTDPSTAADALPAGDLDELGYADAVEELEEILAELDHDDVDVDLLGERVKRAADLVQLCRRRLESARIEVSRIVADLEAVAPLPALDESDDDTPAGGGDGLFATEV